MSEKNESQIITASTTESGAVTYFRADATWTSEIDEAAVLEPGPELDEMLRKAAAQEREVCDPYPMSVRVEGGKIEPVSVRERIRLQGPSTPVRRGDPPAAFDPTGS
jgi:hypothetical protein